MEKTYAQIFEEIAKNFDLWGEYVDPDGTMTREQFDAMSIEEKVSIQRDLFENRED